MYLKDMLNEKYFAFSILIFLLVRLITFCIENGTLQPSKSSHKQNYFRSLLWGHYGGARSLNGDLSLHFPRSIKRITTQSVLSKNPLLFAKGLA